MSRAVIELFADHDKTKRSAYLWICCRHLSTYTLSSRSNSTEINILNESLIIKVWFGFFPNITRLPTEKISTRQIYRNLLIISRTFKWSSVCASTDLNVGWCECVRKKWRFHTCMCSCKWRYWTWIHMMIGLSVIVHIRISQIITHGCDWLVCLLMHNTVPKWRENKMKTSAKMLVITTLYQYTIHFCELET